MDDRIFKNSIRTFNMEYKKIFGYIPCIENYSCTQDEYRDALIRSIQDKKEISEYLIVYTKERVQRWKDSEKNYFRYVSYGIYWRIGRRGN